MTLAKGHARPNLRRAISGPMVLWSNMFFSETARPIKAKFHVEHSWEMGMKVYINGQGHMTKMAAMAINNKNV